MTVTCCVLKLKSIVFWQLTDVDVATSHEVRASRRASCCNTVMCKLCYIHTQLLCHFSPQLTHHLHSLEPFPPVFALSVCSVYSLFVMSVGYGTCCTLVSVSWFTSQGLLSVMDKGWSRAVYIVLAVLEANVVIYVGYIVTRVYN